MIDYEVDDQLEKENQKRAKRRKLILTVISLMFFVLVIVVIVGTRKEPPANRALAIANSVYSNVAQTVRDRDLKKYQGFFLQTPPKDELIMISRFDFARGDDIRFVLSNPGLQIYPSGVTEMKVDVKEMLVFDRRTNVRNYTSFVFQLNGRYGISAVQYNEQMKPYLAALPPSALFGSSH